MCISNRDPDNDVLLFGVAYGIKRPGGYTEWVDPANVIVVRPPDPPGFMPYDLPLPPQGLDWEKIAKHGSQRLKDMCRPPERGENAEEV